MGNRYISILQYLQQFEDDGQYHEIDHLLEGMQHDPKLYQTLLIQARSGKIEKETAMKALTVGDSLSSIGSFILSLSQMLLPLFAR